MPQVIIEQPGIPPMSAPLTGNEITFGRSETNDVVLVAEEVSRQHAKICQRGDKMVLVDCKSLNGTYVNRQRIVERVLSHLDEIWFGSKCRLIYRDDTRVSQHTHDSTVTSPDSRIMQNVVKIREEMNRVGDSMTLIGRQTPKPDALKSTAMPAASPEDVLRMGRAYRRMAALYKASQAMASNFSINQRLARVLDIVIEVMGADRGFVMLCQEDTNNLTVKVAREMGQELQASSPSMGIAGRAAIDGEPVLMNDSNMDQEFGARESIIMNRIAGAMCVPLRTENRILGSIYIDTRKRDVTFVEEDLELFCALAAQAALAIDSVQSHEKAVEAEKKRQNFARFLSRQVVEKIMNEDASLTLGGQKSLVTTLFCDIRGSSKLAEQLTPQELVSLLNEHFTAMTEIVFQYGGMLDKYIGDELMAVFGVPIAGEDDPFSAVCAAMDILKRNQELNILRAREVRPELQVGIGIDTGEVIAGYIGSPMRLEFTVIGDRVNTAKRFCDLAGPAEVVVGEKTWMAVRGLVTANPIGTIMLKGKEKPVQAHKILGLKNRPQGPA